MNFTYMITTGDVVFAMILIALVLGALWAWIERKLYERRERRRQRGER